MSFIYLQEQGEESSAENYSDIPAYALSRLNLMPDRCCFSDSATESCHGSQSGTMSQPLTDDHGQEKSMSFAVDSHVKTLARQVNVLELKGIDLDCGLKWLGSFTKYDQATCSWKTHQCSLFVGLEVFSGAWPRWGIMRDGLCWELSTPARPIDGREFGFLPTPARADGFMASQLSCLRKKQTWETTSSLTARLLGKKFKLSGKDQKPKGKFLVMPRFAQWMMGWPDGWTNLTPLGTGRFRQWLRWHGVNCQELNDEE